MKRNLLLILCLAFCAIQNSFAQNGLTADTLKYSSGGKNGFCIDAKNNKWIATFRGLLKFDGSKWTIYDSTNSSIKDRRITAIDADSNAIWLGTFSAGVVKYDGDTTWKNYTTKDSLPDNRITCIKAKKGKVCVGTLHGISVFNGTAWKKYLLKMG
ncbi:MAG: hypothetical protein NTX03_02265 [Bacteroidetes bacterium]|nr:hypothetical protein [Bacteroidota bacterium]